jgi:transglutaminase-like putative cysteine protease
MKSKSKLLRAALCVSLLLAPAQALFALGDFKPIPADELALKAHPKAPGAHAIILLWTDDQDDTEAHETEYFRIKILTEEGKKYADIEIPYLKDRTSISDIKAQTVRPDGTVVPFTGKPFDKLVVKTRGVKFLAKTFTLPDVQPGSIIEYRYKVSWDYSTFSLSTRWAVQRDLFVKKAILTMKPYTSGPYSSYWLTLGLPPGKNLTKKGSAFELQLEDIPAFDHENNSPPETELKPRIEFFYSLKDVEQPEKYWKRIGKERWDLAEHFIGKRGGIQEAASQLVSPNDNAETKLRKLYARVQQIRNLSYERDKTDQEEKRDKLKDSNNVEDVLKRGYGYHNQLNRLFIAMARAVGIDAGVVKVSQRDEVFFMMGMLDETQLNGEITVARADGKEWFLDPGVAMCPFGLLPWENTGVKSLQLSKDGGTFITTPQPESNKAIMRRVARLKYEDGGYKGKVSIEFRDQMALTRRLASLNSDDAEQKKELEEELKSWLPGGSTVKLAQVTNAKNEAEPLSLEFDVELPGIGSNVGSRMLIPISIFQANNNNPFQHEKRVHPVYFDYPFQELDEVIIKMPTGFRIENLPAAQKQQTAFGYYDSVWQQDGNSISVRRRFAILGALFRQEMYPELRAFYEKVNTSDQESVVLRAQSSSGK